jgi:hypothetical protein
MTNAQAINVAQYEEAVRGPGAMEGESSQTAYFNELSGEGEIIAWMEDGAGEYVELHETTAAERAAFDIETPYVALVVSEQGFISSHDITAVEAEAARNYVA